ncbi:tetratricopeptide repeat protein [Paractinoplanes toevensis]|uniref:ATP-binding protein n=1 Tax=Paractinoplanes toevensis TaxID=571911 RepID=A0A920BPI3_9ACTN|nr:tetratricopeptide repeat protein [Actinoplanes toevensis]GIM96464.1 ATP-binding protein [Actinoplanes toevensis]
MSTNSRQRKDRLTILVVVLSPVVANLAALALQLATMADTSRLPAIVAPVRNHPWLGYLVFTLASALFAAYVWRRDRRPGNRHTHANVPLQAAADLPMTASPTGSGHIRPPTGDLPPLRGRDEQMTWLAQHRRGCSKRVHILTGLGGCGKTTVALAFAASMTREHVTVWWIRARSPQSYVEGMLAVASAAGAPDAAVQRSRELGAVEVAWHALMQYEEPYVLVIDGADDPALLAPDGHTALVRGENAFVLVTSRVVENEAWGREAEVVPLPPLSLTDAAALLLDRIPRRAASAASDAEEVAKRLGRLPLALHLAGRYLGSGVADSDLKRYLRILDNESVRIVDIAARTEGGEAEQQVFHTWEVSLAALEAHGNTHARRLLRYLSMFSAGQPIPVELADWRVLHRAGLLTNNPDDAHDVQFRALSGLKKFGLLQPLDDERSAYKEIDVVAIHPLVAEVSLLRLTEEGENATLLLVAAASALREACDGLDASDPEHWPVWQLLVPHASALLERVELADGGGLRNVLDAIAPIVRQLRMFGLYTVARSLAAQAAAAAEGAGGDQTALLLRARHDLALVQFDCGDFSEAYRLHVQNLSANEENTAAALSTMHHLGLALQAQGHIEQAESMLRGVLDRRVRRFGDNHPAAMSVRHDLASVLHATGKFVEAEQLLREVLSDRNQRLGPTHPDTLSTLHALAYARQAQGDVDGATTLFQKVLAERRLRLGETHPNTLITRHNLAWLVHLSGDYSGAERQLRSVLSDQIDRLGKDHPHTLATQANIAWVLLLQGKYADSYALFDIVLRKRQARLGPDHPDTLTTRGNIAWLRNEEGRWREAEELLRELVRDRIRVLGENHPRTLTTRHNLAQALRSQGNLQEADQIFTDVLRRQEDTLGSTNPSALATKHNRALVWQAQGRLAESEQQLREVLTAQTELLGETHPDVRKTRANLTGVLRNRGVRQRGWRSALLPGPHRRNR